MNTGLRISSRALSLSLGVCLLVAAGGCSGPSLDGVKWRCDGPEDCLEGFQCDAAQGVCVSALDGRHGVFSDRLLVGLSAALSPSSPRHQDGLAIRGGIEACFKEVNETKGGVHQRRLEVVARDDGGQGDRVRANAETFLGAQRDVFALLAPLGDEGALGAQAAAAKFKALLFGPLSGQEALEADPPARYVFNLRPRYAEEGEALLRQLLDADTPRMPAENVAFFLDGENDRGAPAPGIATRVFNAGEALLTARGVTPLVTSHRASDATIDVDNAVRELLRWASSGKRRAVDGRRHLGIMLASSAEALLELLPELEKTLAAVRADGAPHTRYGTFSTNELDRLKTVELRWAAISTYRTEGLPESLAALPLYDRIDEGKTVKRRHGQELLLASPMPNPASEPRAKLVAEYVDQLARHGAGAPQSALGLEAYVVARLFVKALEHHGRGLTDEGFINSLETLKVDLGLGITYGFAPSSHQASTSSWGLRLGESGAWTSVGKLPDGNS